MLTTRADSIVAGRRFHRRLSVCFPHDILPKGSAIAKARPHQQQCQSNRRHCQSIVARRNDVRLCCHKRRQCRIKFRHFDKVETNWTCSVCFDIVERTKFRLTLLPKSATLLPKGQQCRSNIRHCWKNCSTRSIRQCCLDIFADVDGASTKLPVASTMLLRRCCWWVKGSARRSVSVEILPYCCTNNANRSHVSPRSTFSNCHVLFRYLHSFIHASLH